MTNRKFTCHDCKHNWELPFGSGRPQECPSCKGQNSHRVKEEDYQPGNRQRGHKCRHHGGQRTNPAE